MKRIILLSFTCWALSITLSAQGICNPAGNILIYSNYDGGTLTINIDEDIPNIRIGLCSYEDLHVTLTGSYVDNVVEVWYAGYNDDGTTSVTGVDAGIVNILTYPPVYLYDPDGNNYMVCAYECDSTYVPGGCNTVDQATDYFLTELSGSLRYSYMQYGIWSGTYDMSEGGNCCFGVDCVLAIDAGQDAYICEGESAVLTSLGAIDYEWYDDGGLIACPEPCDEITVTPEVTTTYVVIGTDGDCDGLDSVTVFVSPYPVAELTYLDGVLYASGGTEFQWYLDGVIIDGATGDSYTPVEDGIYTVLVTSDEGCEDMSDEFAVAVQGIDATFAANYFTLSPVPASEQLTVHFYTPGNYTVTILNSVGQQITVVNMQGDHGEIHLGNFAQGIYLVRVSTADITYSKQLVIHH